MAGTTGIVFGLIATLFVAANASSKQLKCSLDNPSAAIPEAWITLNENSTCSQAMVTQVKNELHASMSYLSMAAYFSLETVNRPGFAEMFFKSASEEREHAMKILEYLLMRGGLTHHIGQYIKTPQLTNPWKSGTGFEALKAALELETSVTVNIRDIIAKCEDPNPGSKDSFNDYHLVDYLTGEFLTEQYEGQRHLAGLASTLGKMTAAHGSVIGEFLFDKQLLEKK